METGNIGSSAVPDDPGRTIRAGRSVPDDPGVNGRITITVSITSTATAT